MIETKEIFIDQNKTDIKPAKFRDGCRGIIIQDGKILLSYFTKEDFYLIPGGGIEKGEDLHQACIREVEEETAVVVSPGKHLLTVKEYYREWEFTSDFFVCTVSGKGKFNLTENELRRGLEPRWVDVGKALEIFGNYASYKDTDIERYGSYKREFTALSYYVVTR